MLLGYDFSPLSRARTGPALLSRPFCITRMPLPALVAGQAGAYGRVRRVARVQSWLIGPTSARHVMFHLCSIDNRFAIVGFAACGALGCLSGAFAAEPHVCFAGCKGRATAKYLTSTHRRCPCSPTCMSTPCVEEPLPRIDPLTVGGSLRLSDSQSS